MRDILKVTIEGEPVPASRPRVTRWSVYYAKPYATWKEQAEKDTPKGPGALSGPLTVSVEVIVTRPRTSKLNNPKPDVDNYSKAPLDVLNSVGGYWLDDAQIVTLLATKRFAEAHEEARTEVIIQQQSSPKIKESWFRKLLELLFEKE